MQEPTLHEVEALSLDVGPDDKVLAALEERAAQLYAQVICLVVVCLQDQSLESAPDWIIACSAFLSWTRGDGLKVAEAVDAICLVFDCAGLLLLWINLAC